MRRGNVTLKTAIIPKPYKDVDELLRSEGGDAKYEHMIATAQPSMAWMVAHISTRFDLDALDGLSQATDYLLEFLVAEHPVARAKYIQQIAAKLECPESSVWEAFYDMIDRLHRHYARPNTPAPNTDLKTLD